MISKISNLDPDIWNEKLGKYQHMWRLLFLGDIDIIYDNLPSKYWKSIVMGIATYNQSPSKVINKIKYSKVTRFKSVSFFSYNVMDQNPRYFRSIKKILYPKG